MTKLISPKSFGVTKYGEENDCVVRALANASGMPYEDCHAVLKRNGRKDRKGTYIDAMYPAYKEFGFNPIATYGTTCRGTYYTRYLKNEGCKIPHLKGMTLENFLILHPYGSYIVIVTGHAIAVVDGEIIDMIQNKAGKRVSIVFKKS